MDVTMKVNYHDLFSTILLTDNRPIVDHSRPQRPRSFWSASKNCDHWGGPTPEESDSQIFCHSAHTQSKVWQSYRNTKRLCAHWIALARARAKCVLASVARKGHCLWRWARKCFECLSCIPFCAQFSQTYWMW